MKRLYILPLFIFVWACNNSNTQRLSSTRFCGDEDSASFELREGEEDTFETSSEDFVGGSDTYSTTLITVTERINGVQLTYTSSNLSGEQAIFANNCVGGMFADQDQSGSSTVTVPFLTPENVKTVNANVQFDNSRPEGEAVLAATNINVATVVPNTQDLLGYLNSQGYNTEVYTYIEGDRRNLIYFIHAENTSLNRTARIRITRNESEE